MASIQELRLKDIQNSSLDELGYLEQESLLFNNRAKRRVMVVAKLVHRWPCHFSVLIDDALLVGING